MKSIGICLVIGLMMAACGGETASNNVDAAAAAEPVHPGKKIYSESCASCHAPGLSGAPKFGDAEAWAPRIAKGSALLLKSTIDGIPPAMPPRGICMHCSDEQLAAAIDYMVVNSQ